MYYKISIPFPQDDSWVECLRFIVQTIERDDPYFEFCASLLSYALHNNGLSDKQAKSIKSFADKYIEQKRQELFPDKAPPSLELIKGKRRKK